MITLTTPKIILTICIYMLPIIQFWRDWKHADRRTKKYRRITIAIILAWILCGVLAGWVEWKSSISTYNLQAQLESSILKLEQGNENLTEQNKQLAEKIDDYQQKINILSQQAKRGFVDVYNFPGQRIQSSPGKVHINSATEEMGIFKQIVTLYESNKFQELRELASSQIEKTPHWLTPYFFIGLTYLNEGKVENAKVSLQYVVDRAGDDPEYVQAKELLEKIAEMKK